MHRSNRDMLGSLYQGSVGCVYKSASLPPWTGARPGLSMLNSHQNQVYSSRYFPNAYPENRQGITTLPITTPLSLVFFFVCFFASWYFCFLWLIG
jgi:hypothetical protein